MNVPDMSVDDAVPLCQLVGMLGACSLLGFILLRSFAAGFVVLVSPVLVYAFCVKLKNTALPQPERSVHCALFLNLF